MKRIFILVLFYFSVLKVYTQDCIPFGVKFFSQAQVDNFVIDYPDCTEIEGFVEFVGTDIINLDALSQITKIGKYLRIENTSLVNLNGLENVTILGEYLEVLDNPLLENLKGLDNVTNVGGKIQLTNNASIINLEGLESLTYTGGFLDIQNNNSLQNLKGLDNFNTIGYYVKIESNPSLLNLAGLEKITSIGNDFSISHNDVLESIEALSNLTSIGGNCRIVSNPKLSTLSPFSSLQTIDGHLKIRNNDIMTNLNGFEKLTNINGDLVIQSNNLLEDINALSIIEFIGGDLQISNNPLLELLPLFDFLKSISGDLSIQTNASLKHLDGMNDVNVFDGEIVIIDNPKLESINGFNLFPEAELLRIYNNNNLQEIDGLQSLTTINDYLEINENSSLIEVTGFHNLETIGNHFDLEKNPNLIRINGLQKLQSIGEDFRVFQNDSFLGFDGLERLEYIKGLFLVLQNASLVNFLGLNQLSVIGDTTSTSWKGFIVAGNQSLVNFEGLNNLKEIKGDFKIQSNSNTSFNDQLINLEGLDNLEVVHEDLVISNNPVLETLQGLGKLREIYGSFYFSVNPKVKNFEGMSSLEIIHMNFDLWKNEILENFIGLENLTFIYNDFEISECNALVNCIGLSDLQTIGNEMDVRNNTSLPNFQGMESCNYIYKIYLYRNELINLKGLDGLTKVHTIDIRQNHKLINLDGLQSLVEAENIDIDENNNLESLLGLNSLESVQRDFILTKVPKLVNIEALSNLQIVRYDLDISVTGLLNLNGLENLSLVYRGINIEANQNLENIEALNNVNYYQYLDLDIKGNPNLSLCNTIMVCNHLINNGWGYIANNGPGCTSEDEIEQLCDFDFDKFYYRLYADINENAQIDPYEGILQSGFLNVEPLGLKIYANTRDWKIYSLPHGDYEVSFDYSSLPNWFVTTTPAIVPLTIDEENNCDSIAIGIVPRNDISETKAYLSCTRPRCNQDVIYTPIVVNNGTTITSGILWLDIDEITTSITYIDVPDTIAHSNKVGWFFEDLYPTQKFWKKIILGIPGPPDVAVGELYTLKPSVEYYDVNGENYYQGHYCRVIRCSYDPNDKQVNPSRESTYTLFEEDLVYTIRFQNTGNDVAYDVVIRDTLDEHLDYRTFRYLESSHEDVLSVSLENNRNLTFAFNNIFLPDSTSNLEASQGYVTYMITTKDGTPEETLVENTAHIYFDQNPPIVTNTTENLMITAFPVDADEDGFDSIQDCDDEDPLINPDATEIINNEIDEDCDGVAVEIDEDNDGYNSDEDCDDMNPDANPSLEEIPNNLVDEDCDGIIIFVDNDLDGFNSDDDCDDMNANINPDAEEIPNNGIDEDCDGEDLITIATHQIADNTFLIYPNPTTQNIFIEQSDSQRGELILTTHTGHIILNETLKNRQTIDLENYPSGVYILNIQTENGSITEKVVKI